MSLLEVDQLGKQYPTPAEPLVVLKDVNLRADRGQSVAVLGPSGSGKSTLLAILGTLDEPSSGVVRVEGQDPFQLSETALAAFRADRIGFVFQEHYLLPQLSAFENVLLPLLATGPATAAGIARGESLLERVGLTDRRTHRPAELSGGERQRVAIARALVRDPLLLLADEPTGNLDAATAETVTELLVGLQAERDGVLVVVTHSEALANRLDRRVRLINHALEEASV
ncbi:ABC transporter ATP-binding protein [Botrimarina hoheduenensis]|uniref:Lipoprotein-releasing system ATP-binding protein LolD n=1 Tax=Botrimarina hoheduenensis TaxID=2528000 RepID=A0A5C5VXY6_9BACT|nr:ABC transporter ATP-binding protein [Botrimarina hoheduenensis]TWT43304.1 Lipoprotein-releasing system ATP-binding protein LolD [Botrimarina hoheduenensis]